MDLRLLKVFKSVVDCGGMAAAELELNIGTSTVSRHVKDLETRLGLVLCRRGRAGFALTAEGQRVYDETLRLLASVDAFRGSIDDIHNRMGGQLDVALFDKTATNPKARIGEAIARFTEIAPEVTRRCTWARSTPSSRACWRAISRSASSRRIAAPRALCTPTCSTRRCCCIAARNTRCSAPITARLTWAKLREHHFAGLGYHSPNMELSHRAEAVAQATRLRPGGDCNADSFGRFWAFCPTTTRRCSSSAGSSKVLRQRASTMRAASSACCGVRQAVYSAVLAFQECLEKAHR